MSRRYWYLLGFAVIVGICASAFIINPNASYGGSDDAGPAKILQIDPSYVVWFHSLWTPPAETESLLFAVQAAIGAVIIGFFIGNERGKRTERARMAAENAKAIREEPAEKTAENR